MKILVVDCHGARKMMIMFLQKQGHEVYDAYNINDANYYLRESGPFNCIIIDIQGPVDGLTDAEKQQTERGEISGWIWLKNYVLKQNPDLAARIIIYSTSQTITILNRVDPSADEKVKIISIQGRDSGAEKVLAQLKQISKIAEA